VGYHVGSGVLVLQQSPQLHMPMPMLAQPQQRMCSQQSQPQQAQEGALACPVTPPAPASVVATRLLAVATKEPSALQQGAPAADAAAARAQVEDRSGRTVAPVSVGRMADRGTGHGKGRGRQRERGREGGKADMSGADGDGGHSWRARGGAASRRSRAAQSKQTAAYRLWSI